jgi:predicted dehydrogenase
MKKLHVAIIGLGRSGYGIHAHLFKLMARRFKVVAVADPIKERRERVAAELDCDAYAGHEPMLKRDDVDLFVNATPSNLHVPVALDIIKAGHHQVCEKPLARKAKDVDKIQAAVKKKKVMFTVYQQCRLMPYFRKIQEVVTSGDLGRITQIDINWSSFQRRWDWQTLTAFNGGNLQNTGPHPLDHALRLMSVPLHDVPTVCCAMDVATFSGDADGHTTLMLSKKGYPTVTVAIYADCPYPPEPYRICGTRGGLRGTRTWLEWKYTDFSNLPDRRATRKPLVDADGMPGFCGGEGIKWTERRYAVPKSQLKMFDYAGKIFYKNVQNHLAQGEELLVKLDEIRQQVAVIEEACRQNPHIWAKADKRKTTARQKTTVQKNAPALAAAKRSRQRARRRKST